ncbi:MAG: hypothetical protein K0S56_775 [Microvirga sp.]|nr:hypothetical protein [Microvirga sp.]
MPAIERSFRDCIEQAESGDHGAGGQNLDFEVASGHVVDLLGEVEREFVKDVLGGPRALPAHVDRALGLGNVRCSDGCGSADRGGLEETAARLFCYARSIYS